VLSRKLRDQRALARYGGLTGTPDESGRKRREKGLARAGNARVRRGMVQSAWRWLIFQNRSELTQWYRARTAGAKPALRKTMIVALARKLLIALWRYLTTAEVPAGAPCVQRQPEHITSVSATRKASNRQGRICRQRSEVAVTRKAPMTYKLRYRMGLPPRSLAYRCARLHHGSDPLVDGPPPWQARLRSSPLLVVRSDKREDRKSMLEIMPRRDRACRRARASQGVA
jgi:Transposase IS116/IS110/IS902 family